MHARACFTHKACIFLQIWRVYVTFPGFLKNELACFEHAMYALCMHMHAVHAHACTKHTFPCGLGMGPGRLFSMPADPPHTWKRIQRNLHSRTKRSLGQSQTVGVLQGGVTDFLDFDSDL